MVLYARVQSVEQFISADLLLEFFNQHENVAHVILLQQIWLHQLKQSQSDLEYNRYTFYHN